MRRVSLFAASAALIVGAKSLNVLITGDDGFGSANLRELYKQMTSLGHNCYVVASPTAQTRVGAETGFTDSATLLADGDWGFVKADALSLGHDPNNGHLWYYNGTSVTQVLVALDYIFPTVANIAAPDLVVYGPNSDKNVGPFPYTAAGVMGATYVAIERGIPAMAFWTGNTPPMPYSWVNASTEAGLQDPATVTARLASTLVQAFIDKAAGSRILPQGYGVAVDLPYITSYTSDECTNPPFVLASQSEDETAAKVAYNTKTGLFTHVQLSTDGSDGTFGFVGQATAVNPVCLSSVMVFAVNYDAAYTRDCSSQPNATAIIPVIVHSNGSTPVVGGLGPNASVTANHSHPTPTPLTDSPPPTETPITSMGMGAHWSMSAMMLGLGLALLMV